MVPASLVVRMMDRKAVLPSTSMLNVGLILK